MEFRHAYSGSVLDADKVTANSNAPFDEGTTIGVRLRGRRKVLRLTLAHVAQASGVSEGFLSQLERDRNTASIATLQRVCSSLQMTVGELFATQPATSVYRYAESRHHSVGSHVRKVRITPTTNRQLEGYVGEFDAHGSTGDEPYSHGDSEEMLMVVSGRVEVTIGNQVDVLSALDSVSYMSSTPHKVREIAGEPAFVLWVMSPPSY